MTQVTCPSCRLRFGRAAAAILASCPECGRPLEDLGSAAASIGFRLFDPSDPDPALPVAVEAALPIPGPRDDRS